MDGLFCKRTFMVFPERLFGLLGKQEIFFEDRFELGERLYDVPLAVPNDEEFFPFGNVLPHRCRDHDLGSETNCLHEKTESPDKNKTKKYLRHLADDPHRVIGFVSRSFNLQAPHSVRAAAGVDGGTVCVRLCES